MVRKSQRVTQIHVTPRHRFTVPDSSAQASLKPTPTNKIYTTSRPPRIQIDLRHFIKILLQKLKVFLSFMFSNAISRLQVYALGDSMRFNFKKFTHNLPSFCHLGVQ